MDGYLDIHHLRNFNQKFEYEWTESRKPYKMLCPQILNWVHILKQAWIPEHKQRCLFQEKYHLVA